MREYLLYCESCKEYTSLGPYDDREKRFEGEYSFLYNARTRNDEMLIRFLNVHRGHPLQSAMSRTELYSRIVTTSRHFMEDELDKFVEESLWRQGEKEQQLTMDRELGRLQLFILRKLLEEEAAATARTTTGSPAESQFMLGKEEGIKRTLAILQELLEKTATLNK